MKVFCDLDGTLIDVSERHHRVYEEVTTSFGGTPLDKTTYWELKRQKTTWPELLEKSHLSPDLVAAFLDAFITKIEASEYLSIDMLFPGALAVLEKMTTLDSIYLVSLRRNRENLLKEVKRLGIDGYFQKILTAHSESDGSDKKIELITAELSPPEKAIIIGDTEADIQTGQQLGLITIAVLSGIRSRQFLEALKPDYILNNINELTKLRAQLSN